jgi:hypothetical protein
MLVRIQADTDKIKKVKSPKDKERLQQKVDTLTGEYNKLLEELKKSRSQ